MAVPDESPAEDTLRLINDKTSGLSTNYVLALPDLKVSGSYMSRCYKKGGIRVTVLSPFFFKWPL